MPAFERTTYSNETFHKIEPSHHEIEGCQFEACTFLACQLKENLFRQCRFDACTFQACNLSLARFPHTQFRKVVFKSCRLSGVNWCEADWHTGSLLVRQRVAFTHCLLDHGVFIGLDLEGTGFSHCTARHLDFEGANLTGANFHQTDLSGTRFVGCDLSQANFTGATGYQINAAENTLHETRFSLPEAIALLHSLDIILEE